MQKQIHITVSRLLCASLILLAACSSSRGGFSLARSKSKNLDECQTLIEKKKHEEAIRCLESFKSRNFDSAGVAEADLSIADSYFNEKDYLVAAEAYNLFIESYPGHIKVPYAYTQSGISYLKYAPKSVDRDQTYLEMSLKALQAVVNYYGSSPYAQKATDYYTHVLYRLAKKEFYIGKFYYKSKQYLAAIPRFESVVADYPKIGLEDDSFYYMINALKKTDQDELAQKYFDLYKKHYPDRENVIKKLAGLF